MGKRRTIGKLKSDLDKVFNKWIRYRDSEDGYCKCISCGQVFSFEDTDAGHFYAKQGYDGLRYDEDNVNGEHSYCNRYDESHLIGYSENLKVKLGEEKYEALKQRALNYKAGFFKWDRGTIEGLIIKYKDKLSIYI